MARAETAESVGKTARNGLFSQHNNCCLELTHPLQTWPGRLSTATITISSGADTSPMRLQRNGHRLLPLQAVCVSYPLSYLHPEDQDQPSSHQELPTLSSAPHPLPLHNQGGETDEGFPGERSGWDQEPPYNRRGPLPDLLPQTERLSRLASPPLDHTVQLRLRRMGVQLRTVGDEFNATRLRRADGPYWQVWCDACRALLNFLTQALSALCRLT